MDTFPSAQQNEALTDDQLRMLELVNRLVYLIVPSKNPRIKICALAYACGIDISFMLNCQNTEIGIAKAIGATQQTFHWNVEQIIKEFNIINVNKLNKTTEEKYEYYD